MNINFHRKFSFKIFQKFPQNFGIHVNFYKIFKSLYPKIISRNFPGICKISEYIFPQIISKIFCFENFTKFDLNLPKISGLPAPEIIFKILLTIFFKILLELIFPSYKDSSKLLQNLPTIFSFLQKSFRFLVLPKFL